MMPLTTTAPSTASGTVRRGLRVSSASGAAASNPPKASTARLNASSTSLEPPGQWNGVADSPEAPPRTRMVMLSASSSTTSNTYSATVIRTPNFSPTTTGATTRTPYRIVTIWVMPHTCGLPSTFCTM
jgi:hypothetical protein